MTVAITFVCEAYVMTEDPEKDLRARLGEATREVPTSRLGRIWKTGRTAVGIGAALLSKRPGKDPIDLAAVSKLVLQMGELRGLAMKGGQILSYIDPSVPPELRAMLSLLQTSAIASDPSAIADAVRAGLGARSAVLLEHMEPKPFAVASIGQVHRAQLPDGTQVAVKVRHPGIDTALKGEFATAGAGSSIARLFAPGANVESFVDEARTAILEECDFTLEAQRQSTFERLFAGDATLTIPHVEAEWCAASVLTTRWSPGRSFNALLASNPSQAERDRIGEALFRFYVGTLYRHGLFHADPHPGNYGFPEDGRVVVYDFGCVRSFEPAIVRALAQMTAAVRADDSRAMAQAFEAFGAKPAADASSAAHVRSLLRGFFGPLLTLGPRRIEPGEGFAAQQLFKDKRAMMRLQLPGRLLFLFRLRFGLYSVLSQLGACADWAALESGWAASVLQPAANRQ